MILVFGGTTEGRIAAETLDHAGKPFFYSTKCGLQEISTRNAVPVSGAMDAEEIKRFIADNFIRLIVDAAHPFAVVLHANIDDAAQEASIDVIRFSRKTLKTEEPAIFCDTYDDAVSQIRQARAKRLLALTGVRTLPHYQDLMSDCEIIFRVLDRKESKEEALAGGVSLNRLIFYDSEDPGAKKAIQTFRPDAIITKESGQSGGLREKLNAAAEYGIPIYVVKAPDIRRATTNVYGAYGLRMAVERLLPGFFDLRIGFTTGSCATAAAVAATTALLSDRTVDYAEFTLPDDEPMAMEVAVCAKVESGCWKATVVKDAGDDPDVTDRCRISATVSKAADNDIEIIGGEGVGRVTLPGLGIPVGEAAINPVPKKMIIDNLRSIYPEGGLSITIAVENGREIAERTFNPKVGVIGGISILGTSGIVKPFSHEAFVESISREISVAMASGSEMIVINSGAKSQRKLKEMFPSLPAYAFIHYGNAIRETLEAAKEAGVKRLVMGIMIGKAVKMAEGHLNTHSHNVSFNRDFIGGLAQQVHLPAEAIAEVRKIRLARQLWDILPPENHPDFYNLIQSLCLQQARRIFSSDLEIIIIRD